MFGLWPRIKPRVLHYWYAMLPDFDLSVSEFYQSIIDEIEAQEIPDLKVSVVEHPEGSLLSARRKYLRIRRERLIFDVCCAPLGKKWFFSCRHSEIPLRFRIWHLFVLAWVLYGFYMLYTNLFGDTSGIVILSATVIGGLCLLGNVKAMGLYTLDGLLLKIPVLGAFYEIFLRADTYYREDTRTMYLDYVNEVIQTKVRDVAGAQEMEHVEFKYDPVPPKRNLFDFIADGMDWFGRKIRTL